MGILQTLSFPLLTQTLRSASSATIVRFPFLYSLTDIDDFLYSTSNVAIWSTIETGLGITAAGVATLRPLLRTFFGAGSSGPGYGPSGGEPSGRHWRRTGSGHPTKGTNRGDDGGEGGFDLHDRGHKGLGVTTVIDYGDRGEDDDAFSSPAGAKKAGGDDSGSDTNPFAGGPEDWNSSQSNLTDDQQPAAATSASGTSSPTYRPGWNITVKKSIVQTRGDA